MLVCPKNPKHKKFISHGWEDERVYHRIGVKFWFNENEDEIDKEYKDVEEVYESDFDEQEDNVDEAKCVICKVKARRVDEFEERQKAKKIHERIKW